MPAYVWAPTHHIGKMRHFRLVWGGEGGFDRVETVEKAGILIGLLEPARPVGAVQGGKATSPLSAAAVLR